MKILALDSSGNVASAAVLDEKSLIAEYTINYKKTHSQTLLPMLDEIVRMTELDLNTIDAIAVAAGPGSFTGLRIGSATAKGLGLALNKPLVGVPTVAAMACSLYNVPGLICPIMDARRNQVYTGIYRFENGQLITVEDQMALGIGELIEKLNARGEAVTFLGDGVPVFEATIREGMMVPFGSIIKKEKRKPQRNTIRTICGYPRRSGNVPRGRRKKPEKIPQAYPAPEMRYDGAIYGDRRPGSGHADRK